MKALKRNELKSLLTQKAFSRYEESLRPLLGAVVNSKICEGRPHYLEMSTGDMVAFYSALGESALNLFTLDGEPCLEPEYQFDLCGSVVAGFGFFDAEGVLLPYIALRMNDTAGGETTFLTPEDIICITGKITRSGCRLCYLTEDVGICQTLMETPSPPSLLDGLTAAQRNGEACIHCGGVDGPLVPVPGLESPESAQLFRCETCSPF